MIMSRCREKEMFLLRSSASLLEREEDSSHVTKCTLNSNVKDDENKTLQASFQRRPRKSNALHLLRRASPPETRLFFIEGHIARFCFVCF